MLTPEVNTDARNIAKTIIQGIFDEAAREVMTRKIIQVAVEAVFATFASDYAVGPGALPRLFSLPEYFHQAMQSDTFSALGFLSGLGASVVVAASTLAIAITTYPMHKLNYLKQTDPAQNYAVNPEANGHKKVYEIAQHKIDEFVADKVRQQKGATLG